MEIKEKTETVRVFGKVLNMGLLAFFMFLSFVSCQYARPDWTGSELEQHTRDSLDYLYQYHYTWNTNLTLCTDSVRLACLPVKGKYHSLYRGDQVVVAEFAIDPQDTVDSVWVKLAHSQEIQGWMRESDMKQVFVPNDSVSEFIYVFSRTHASYFLFILALFIGVFLLRAIFKKQLPLVYFNDIDSAYPLLLCLLMAFSATVYETMQVFVPETWEHFYYNPTLSPFQVPLILSLFLISIWAFVVVFLSALDDLFRQLPPIAALFYLLGLIASCIFCYFFFILTTRYYVGYLFLIAFAALFLHRLYISLCDARYTCGACGGKMRDKGICPHCGAMNQ
ncbi:hypothetical protein, membrane [gut metagenome]|uniref:Transmembrane protein n=1 Tax=gut metagenome TaxID=749906 RepID=J9FD79_9ZZZZ